MNIFDTHAHYDDESFADDFDSVIKYVFENGVSNIINVGCDLESSLKSIEFAKRFPVFFAAVGIHPENCSDLPTDWIIKLSQLLCENKVIAIGEIGLDYHYDEPAKSIQQQVFEQQLILANEHDLPVIIHSRDALIDTMNILNTHKPKGVMHCFSGSADTAKQVLELGMYLGFTGVVTFKNAKKVIEALKIIPLDRILLETDCPYMSPEPFRGKRTTSDLIFYTAQKIAEIKGISTQEMIDMAHKNANRLFKI